MDPSQASDRYMASAFVYKGRMLAGRGGGGGGLWEGGNTLERLNLVEDDAEWKEVPIKLPQDVFHVSVVYNSEVIVIGGIAYRRELDGCETHQNNNITHYLC